MPDPDTVLLLVMRDPSGNLLLVDAKGTQRLAGSGADLWHACHEILNDPDVPRHEHVGGDQALAEEAVTEFVAAHLPPGLHRLAPMAVSVGLEGLCEG